SGLGRQCQGQLDSLWLPSLRKDRDDWTVLLASLGQLYVAGVALDWEAFDREEPRRRVSLPTYPFQRERCWVESAWPGAVGTPAPHRHTSTISPLLGYRLHSALPEILFESHLSIDALAFLDDHCVYGTAVLPAAAMLAMAQMAAAEVFGAGPYAATDVII